MLQSMGLQKVGLDLVIEQQNSRSCTPSLLFSFIRSRSFNLARTQWEEN